MYKMTLELHDELKSATRLSQEEVDEMLYGDDVNEEVEYERMLDRMSFEDQYEEDNRDKANGCY